MNGEPLRHTLVITNPQGLHMRPIAAFVETANRYQSSLLICKEGGTQVNGKSIMNLMSLGAEEGTKIILEISGPDGEVMLKELVEVLERTKAE